MPFEIERKFLIKNGNWKKHANSGVIIRQGYLNAHKERTVRVRIKGKKAYLTVKGKTVNATRPEYEYEIPLQDAENMLELCEQPIIEKIRYEIFLGKLTWEIDEFLGINEGLTLAEVELEEVTQQIDIPEWCGEEVTTDSRYYNSNLIKFPYVEWKK